MAKNYACIMLSIKKYGVVSAKNEKRSKIMIIGSVYRQKKKYNWQRRDLSIFIFEKNFEQMFVFLSKMKKIMRKI